MPNIINKKQEFKFEMPKFDVPTYNDLSDNLKIQPFNSSPNIEEFDLDTTNSDKLSSNTPYDFTENYDNTLGDIKYDEIKSDGFTAQGYTTYNGLTYISAYSDSGENSRIYVYDENGLANTIILDNTAHVGGISVDDNGILFVTRSGGKIDTYDLNSLSKELPNNEIVDFTSGEYDQYRIENNIDALKDVATLYCFDGKLYTATYANKGTIMEFDYSFKDGKIDATANLISDNAASVIQGLSVYQGDDGNQYLVAASSSDKIGSRIRIYRLEDNKLVRVASHNSRIPGLEGIHVDDNGNITGICEYGEQVVRDFGNVDDYVEIVDASHVDFLNNNFLFACSGLVWDLQHWYNSLF